MKTKGIKLLFLMVFTISSLTGIVNTLGFYIEPPIYEGYITCSGFIRNLDGDPIEGAWVQLIDENGREIGSFEFTSSTGHYSVTGRASRQYIKVQASTNGESEYVLRRAPGTYTVNFYFDIPSEEGNKIAYFLHNNHADPMTITSYGGILYDKGFDTVIHNFDEISYHWEEIIDQIDAVEGEEDYVFIFIIGHGKYLPDEDNSYVSIEYDNFMYSDDLNTNLAKLESKHIFVLIEACYSGGFSDLNGIGRCIITATDNYHWAMRTSDPMYGYFSDYFFQAIESGHSETYAYNYANNMLQTEHNQYQYPQMDDQDSDTWFG